MKSSEAHHQCFAVDGLDIRITGDVGFVGMQRHGTETVLLLPNGGIITLQQQQQKQKQHQEQQYPNNHHHYPSNATNRSLRASLKATSSLLSGVEDDLEVEEEEEVEQSNKHDSFALSNTSFSPQQPPSQKNIADNDNKNINNSPDLSLHTLCSGCDVTVDEVRAILAIRPHLAAQVDSDGKLPLHHLGENLEMLCQRRNREVLGEIAHELMHLHPEAITTEDHQGQLPFLGMIRKWVQGVYGGMRRTPTTSSRIEQLTSRLSRKTVGSSADGAAIVNKSGSMSTSSSTDQNAAEMHCESTAKSLFPQVDIDVDVDWCFCMLSLGLDHILGKFLPQGKRRPRELRRTEAKKLVEHLAAIPGLVRTILLIEYDEIRQQLCELSVMRRLLLTSGHIGPWLVAMLQRKGVPSQRAVQFLIDASNTTISDFLGPALAPRSADFEAFQEAKEGVFHKIAKLHNLVPSLLALRPIESEMACSTSVIRKVVSTSLCRPFVVSVIIKDFVYDIVLLIAYRNAVLLPPIDGSPIPPGMEEYAQLERMVIIVLFCHFVLQKVTEAFSIMSISRRLYRKHLTNVWSILDLVTLGLLMGSVQYTTPSNIFQGQLLKAMTLFFLWIKLLDLLRAVNVELATFILSILQIVADIRWFLVVMVLAIFAFGDMLHLLFRTLNDGALCQSDYLEFASEDFCKDDFMSSYIRMYIIFVGDFVLDHYKEDGAITATFVIFTFLGFIVLGNVLIAVVGDSYEKTRTTSQGKFGQARLDFAVAHLSLERMAVPALPIYEGSKPLSLFFQTFAFMYGWVVVLSMLATACVIEYFLIETLTNHPELPLWNHVVSGVLAVILALSVMTIADSLLDDFRALKKWKAPFHMVVRFFVEFITTTVYGIKAEERF